MYARAHGNELWCLLMQKVWTDACRVRVIVPLHHRLSRWSTLLFPNVGLTCAVHGEHVPPLILHALSRSRACKFWQAFAKSAGSYLALESGLSSEALEDITGCPSVRMAFDDPVVKTQVDSGALFDTLRLCDQVSYAGRGGCWKPVHPRSTHGGALISIWHT